MGAPAALEEEEEENSEDDDARCEFEVEETAVSVIILSFVVNDDVS